LTVGLFGLVASFHGLILASGRSSFEFGKAGFAPSFLGKIHSKFQTPANALLFNMFLGVIALFTNKTAEIITISVMGALTLYLFAMLSILKLRRSEPNLKRPFKTPGYPFTPILALVIAGVSLVLIAMNNLNLFFIYLSIHIICFLLFKLFFQKSKNHD
jgi:ethanolamine permease